MYMDFGANKTFIEKIKRGAFGGTYFKEIYSDAGGKWYRKSGKDFNDLKSVDGRYYCSNYYDVSINKHGVKCGTSLKFWENKGWTRPINPYGWCQ